MIRRFLVLGVFTTIALAVGQEVPGDLESELPAPVANPGQSETERQEIISYLREAYAKPRSEWPKPDLDTDRPHREIGPVSEGVVSPKENPMSETKARLGLSLFFDVRLSGPQHVSCASCHEPQLGWSNGTAFSFGVNRTQIKRHPLTLVGVGHEKVLFWDGRATSLEQQAHDVIVNPEEMAGDPDQIVGRLEKEADFYRPLFKKAFGDDGITFERVLQAIGAFERTIRAGRTRFDRFASGQIQEFNDSELSGLHLFRTKARCINCHMGPMFNDGEFHNLGLTYYGRRFEDLGRYNVTKKVEDVGKFRTPTLRNIDRTAPYMHNGIFPSVEGLIRLYNAGMPHPKPKEHQKNDPLFPVTSLHLKPLRLTAQEMADLRSFLSTLTEPLTRVLVPPVPPLKADPKPN